MIRAGQGLHAGGSARRVAALAALDALQQAGGGTPDLVLVFATEGYDPSDVLRGVRDVADSAPLSGCRVPGVLACGRITHDGVGVLAITGGDLVACSAAAKGVEGDPRGAGARAAAAAMEALEAKLGDTATDRTVLLAFPDAIRGNSCEVVRGLDAAVGAATRLSGGGAGDDLNFKQTFQLANDQVLSDGVAVLALGTKSHLGLALRHGCLPWGPPMMVTRASGKTVHELDWSTAFERYVDVANRQGRHAVSRDSFVSFAMLHPFGIPQGVDTYVLRSPLQIGSQGSIACCADVPLDGVMRVMRGDEESLLDASREAGAVAVAQLGRVPPTAAIVLACVSRDFVVGSTETSREIAAVREGLGADVPIFGCLTFGQIGSLHGGAAQFHSKSISVCALPSA